MGYTSTSRCVIMNDEPRIRTNNKKSTFILRSDSGKRVMYWKSKSIKEITVAYLLGKNKQAQTQTHTQHLVTLRSKGVNPTRLDSWFWFWWAFLYQWYVWCNPLTTRSIPVPFRSLPLVWENNRCHVTLSHIVALPPKNQKSPLDSNRTPLPSVNLSAMRGLSVASGLVTTIEVRGVTKLYCRDIFRARAVLLSLSCWVPTSLFSHKKEGWLVLFQQ